MIKKLTNLKPLWQNIIPRQVEFTTLLAIAYLILLGSYEFMNRAPVFHDEIINTFNGSTWRIFNYAARPISYGFNALFIQMMGANVKTLQFSGLIFFIITGYLVFIIGNHFSRFCGIVGLLIYSLFANQWLLGIQGMPHTTLATIILLVIFVWLKLQPVKANSLGLVSFGALTYLPILTHPTGLGFVLGISFSFCLQLFFNRRPLPAFIACLWFSIGQIAVIIVSEITFHIAISSSYLGYWLNGINKVQVDARFIGSHKPFGYYWAFIWSEYSFLVVIALFLLLLLSLVAISNPMAKQAKSCNQNNLIQNLHTVFNSDARTIFIFLCSTTFISILFISMSSWKFDRVMIGFNPLVSITLALAIELLLRLLVIDRFRNVMYSIVFFALAMVGTFQFVEQINIAKITTPRNYMGHQAIIDYIRSLPSSRIGWFATGRDRGKSGLLAVPAQKEIVFLDYEKAVTFSNDEFITYLSNQELEFVIINKSLPKKVRNQIMEVATPYCHLTYQYLWLYEIWQCHKYSIKGPLTRKLATLPRNTQIAMLKSKESRELSKFLRTHLLRPIVLNKMIIAAPNKISYKYILSDQPIVNHATSESKLKHILVASEILPDSMGNPKEFYLYRLTKRKSNSSSLH